MLDGKEIDHLPAGEGAQSRVVPLYETIEGWKEPTANARSWADLPAQAIKYVRRVEELVGCPIALLSTSRSARILFWCKTRSRLNAILPESPQC